MTNGSMKLKDKEEGKKGKFLIKGTYELEKKKVSPRATKFTELDINISSVNL